MKLCKDCLWHREFPGEDDPHVCTEPMVAAAAESYITGMTYCRGARKQQKPCGLTAERWQPIPRRWWQFWRPQQVEAK